MHNRHVRQATTYVHDAGAQRDHPPPTTGVHHTRTPPTAARDPAHLSVRARSAVKGMPTNVCRPTAARTVVLAPRPRAGAVEYAPAAAAKTRCEELYQFQVAIGSGPPSWDLLFSQVSLSTEQLAPSNSETVIMIDWQDLGVTRTDSREYTAEGCGLRPSPTPPPLRTSAASTWVDLVGSCPQHY